jgi:sugar O-acyltransferase (sialic acid O-acetyltransferase NeuD family)
MNKKIAIYGAGGFGKEVCCIINKINEQKPQWDVIGFFDDGLPIGSQISNFGKILGGLEVLNSWNEEINIVFAIGNPSIIKSIVEKLTNTKINFPNIIHPESFFADIPSLKIGKGNVIVRGCSYSCDVEIGDFNQFNSISSLAHDCKVGSFNIFMPLVRVSGGAKIGDLNLFGIGSVILQNIKIGNNTRISAGSYLMRNTKDGFLYAGNPAKKFDI